MDPGNIKMDRRTFIKASAMAALSTQLQIRADVKERPSLNKKLVIICSDFGFEVNNWATSYQEIFDPFKDKMTLFKGVDQPTLRKGHDAADGILTCLTYKNRHRFQDTFVSLDQYIVENSKREHRFKSLYYKTSTVKSISWNSQAQAMPAFYDPYSFYKHVFKPVDLKSESALLKEKRLVYETLADEISKQSKFDSESQKMINILESNIRDIDVDLGWLKKPKPKVTLEIGSDYRHEDSYVTIPKTLEIVNQAIEKKQTNVSVISLSEVSRRIPLDGVRQGYHDLTHHCHKDNESMQQLVKIDHHILKSVADFILSLKKKDLLDETIVLLVGSLGDASTHSNKNLPVILFGGGFNHQNKIDCIRDGKLVLPLCNVYNSIIKQVGLKTRNFAGVNQIVKELFA